MISNQEYHDFIERYRHIVFSLTAELLYKYVVYPIGWKDNQRIHRDDYHEYNWYDIQRFNDNNKLVIPDGPFELIDLHVFRIKNPNPVIYRLKKGMSQYESFVYIISRVTDTHFSDVIDRYAKRDCDCTLTTDCAETLARKLRSFWKLT